MFYSCPDSRALRAAAVCVLVILCSLTPAPAVDAYAVYGGFTDYR